LFDNRFQHHQVVYKAVKDTVYEGVLAQCLSFHAKPPRAQVFYGMMQGRTFSLATLGLGVSHALESGRANFANGFILPIL